MVAIYKRVYSELEVVFSAGLQCLELDARLIVRSDRRQYATTCIQHKRSCRYNKYTAYVQKCVRGYAATFCIVNTYCAYCVQRQAAKLCARACCSKSLWFDALHYEL
jgi:hypothetical protein